MPSEDGNFQVEVAIDESGFCEIIFAHTGGAARDAEIKLGFLDDGGVARAGDGQDLGLVDRDVRVVVFDHERIDRSSIQADYAVGVPSDRRFAMFLTWRKGLGAERLSATGVVGSFARGESFRFEPALASEEAIAFLLGSELIHKSNLSLLPVPPEPERTHFTTLSVSGFRGFARERTLRFAEPNGSPGSGLTILVGANNSGKSTFLEALHSIARGRDQVDLNFPQPRRHRDTDKVTLELTRSDGRQLRVQSIREGGSQAEAKWLPEGMAPGKFDIHLTPSRRNFSPYFGNMGAADRNWGFVNAELSRTELREQFVGRLRKVDREPDARRKFDELLTAIVGYPLDWTIDEVSPNQQFLKLIESDGAWHTSEGLGDGLVSMLFLVDALYDSDPGALIAIDEPELSLHPQIVRRLGRVLSRYSADRQIVVATHSPLLIDWADIANGATVARMYKSGGRSEISQASSEILQSVAGFTDARNPSNPHIIGTVAREALFLEDGVILTEGQDDVTYLARVLDDLRLPRADNIYGWGAGGVGNIPALAQLFVELGFVKIGAILDDDGNAGTLATLAKLRSMAPEVLVRQIPAPDIRYKKASPARPEVVGLLDRDNVHVREDLRESASRALGEVLDHVQPTTLS